MLDSEMPHHYIGSCLCFQFAQALGLLIRLGAVVTLVQNFMGSLMNYDPTFCSDRETLPNHDPPTG
jgi:hypothetical protein